MALGIFNAALEISSAMCTEASAPTKVATFPKNPTQYERPWVGQPPSFKLVAKTEATDPCGEYTQRTDKMAMNPAK